jgi:hypothetical protein
MSRNVKLAVIISPKIITFFKIYGDAVFSVR